ncbi:hypothetical protein F5Y19DRAFT_475494 [Xylariaceae sp. FL1651]|nr:hypothetical protein F5Y19DRAFT_475494 [Xylariaceae sp. FL1651]
MKALSGMFSSWFRCISQCCQPVNSYLDEKPHNHDTLNSFAIIHDEPSSVPPPSVAPFRYTPEVLRREERAPRKEKRSGWSSFSARRRLLSSSNTSLPRRPRISSPSNFRHVYSESFHFPGNRPSETRARPMSFRPLELNIYMTDSQLSPILPHFDYPSPPVTPPPRAFTVSSRSDDSPSISHQRSYSSMSFHIPRRPVNGGSVFDSPRSDTSTPQRPQPVRTRGQSPLAAPSPIMEDLVERVANAMLERDRLQDQIDDVIERQSIYTSSRPSTAYGQPGWSPDQNEESIKQQRLTNPAEMEPMPEIPALPPNAPSFSERLSSDRLQTAPSKPPIRVPYQANSSRKIEGRVPPPPLPLRLRPPLRKKKSFSRVSTWLFPAGGEHKRDISLDSLTNAPKPVTDAEGFYQVAPLEPGRRPSSDSESTVSDWTIEEEQTLPTSLSPSSTTTPRAMAGPPMVPQFGLREPIHFQQRKSVGVAF